MATAQNQVLLIACTCIASTDVFILLIFLFLFLRIYSKISRKKVLELSSEGLSNMISVFLTLCHSCDLEDIIEVVSTETYECLGFDCSAQKSYYMNLI